VIKIRFWVSGETGDFAFVVCAESLRRATQSVKERYPGSAVAAIFPIEPDCLIVGDTHRGEYIELEVTEGLSQPGKVIAARA
jgi:hypothetical protein